MTKMEEFLKKTWLNHFVTVGVFRDVAMFAMLAVMLQVTSGGHPTPAFGFVVVLMLATVAMISALSEAREAFAGELLERMQRQSKLCVEVFELACKRSPGPVARAGKAILWDLYAKGDDRVEVSAPALLAAEDGSFDRDFEIDVIPDVGSSKILVIKK